MVQVGQGAVKTATVLEVHRKSHGHGAVTCEPCTVKDSWLAVDLHADRELRYCGDTGAGHRDEDAWKVIRAAKPGGAKPRQQRGDRGRGQACFNALKALPAFRHRGKVKRAAKQGGAKPWQQRGDRGQGQASFNALRALPAFPHRGKVIRAAKLGGAKPQQQRGDRGRGQACFNSLNALPAFPHRRTVIRAAKPGGSRAPATRRPWEGPGLFQRA
ncbi:hypothetical protein NDU88_004106 [Pleurodeles waltl]|uniref:Uncharacterized protein n=1 Tax=Pleurodeles waltl TaxID=8319 RepID=A0AAV7PIT5_PLEWA|nr:hypothetical protein NDU88_004106 [Pleurodeles waltl]